MAVPGRLRDPLRHRSGQRRRVHQQRVPAFLPQALHHSTIPPPTTPCSRLIPAAIMSQKMGAVNTDLIKHIHASLFVFRHACCPCLVASYMFVLVTRLYSTVCPRLSVHYTYILLHIHTIICMSSTLCYIHTHA